MSKKHFEEQKKFNEVVEQIYQGFVSLYPILSTDSYRVTKRIYTKFEDNIFHKFLCSKRWNKEVFLKFRYVENVEVYFSNMAKKRANDYFLIRNYEIPLSSKKRKRYMLGERLEWCVENIRNNDQIYVRFIFPNEHTHISTLKFIIR